MTKKVDTWMPLLVDKYLGDTTHLNTEQHGAYLLLLMSMWKKDGSLPDDDEQLAQIARLPAARWRATRRVLVDGMLLRVDGERIIQKRLTEELKRSKSHTEKKAAAGKTGAEKRWQTHSNANGKTDGNAIADASQSHWQTGASTPPPTPIPKPSGQARTTGTSVAALGAALARAGLDPTTWSLSNPGLIALAEQGATPEEVEDVARAAVGKRNPVPWVIATVQGRREDAARVALAPKQAAPQSFRERERQAAEAVADAWGGPELAALRRKPATETVEVIDVDATPKRLG